jgi:hypothetical protein
VCAAQAMGVPDAVFAMRGLQPAVGLCIAVGCGYKPFVRSLVDKGVAAFDAIDAELYHDSSAGGGDAASAAAAAAVTASALDAFGSPDRGGDAAPPPPTALRWRSRVASATQSLAVTAYSGALYTPVHRSCPLHVPSLHAAALVLCSSDGSGGGRAAEDDARLRRLLSECLQLKRYAHARFLAGIVGSASDMAAVLEAECVVGLAAVARDAAAVAGAGGRRGSSEWLLSLGRLGLSSKAVRIALP